VRFSGLGRWTRRSEQAAGLLAVPRQ
jgi:hypothetical protein